MGPNPRVVRWFAAECGADLELAEIDIMGAENRSADFLKLNPTGQLPALELDDGSIISEITAICEYLDETSGHSELIGTSAEMRAETRMWTRRVDLAICENLANGFRYGEGQDIFRDRMRLIPQASDDLKAIVQEKVTWLDGDLEGKTFICGDRFSLADILLFCFLDFGAMVGQPLNPDNANVAAWFERVKSRPAAEA
jgi:glutathione S-transferase